MSVEDMRMANTLRHEVVKRSFDSSRLDVRVHHGVVYLSGEVRPLRGQTVDLRKEMEVLHHIFRNKPGVREVVDDARIYAPFG